MKRSVEVRHCGDELPARLSAHASRLPPPLRGVDNTAHGGRVHRDENDRDADRGCDYRLYAILSPWMR